VQICRFSSIFDIYIHKYAYFNINMPNRLDCLTPFKHYLNGLNTKQRVTDCLLFNIWENTAPSTNWTVVILLRSEECPTPTSLLLIWLEFFGVLRGEDLCGMNGYTFEMLVLWSWGVCLARVDVNTRSRLLTDQAFFLASKQWVREGERSVDGKYHSLSGHTIRQSSR